MRSGLLVLGLFAWGALAQQPAQMPPSEELKAATAPFEAARAQPDDLTDADRLALRVGVSRSAQACLALQPSLASLSSQSDELLAFSRLCIFGQQFEPARQGAVQYLTLPATPKREMALLLLVQAFLGLKDFANAAQQVFSLERDFSYDAQIHYAEDQVLLAGALLGYQQNSDALQICATQTKASRALLGSGHGLLEGESNASPGTLFADAVRCLDIARALHDASASATLNQLKQIVALPVWQGTAEFEPMQAALARAEMVNSPTPATAMSGKFVRATGLSPTQLVPLGYGTVLLVPFTLWAPSTLATVRSLPTTAVRQPVYLVTSWSANTGGVDKETPELVAALRDYARALPKHVSILVVPKALLEQFHADVFPTAIVIRDGMVQANVPLVGEAAERIIGVALGATSSDSPRNASKLR